MSDDPQPGDDSQPGAWDPEQPPPGWPFGPGDVDLTQIMRMLQSEGPVNWEVAQQVASWVALEGTSARPIEEQARTQLDELVHAAQTHVVAETGLNATFRAPLRTVDPSEWANHHLDALRPVLEALATTLQRAMDEGDDDEPSADAPGPFGVAGDDPFGGMLQVMAPLLLGVQAGSLVGYLAQHALGRYDLPLPSSDEPSLLIVVQNLDDFEAAWSLPRADLRFYLALHETVHAAQRSVRWVRDRLVRLATEYVSGYQIDPSAIEAQFGEIDPEDPSSFNVIASQPEALLGAMQTPRQAHTMQQLQVFTAALEGFADHVVERVGTRLIPTFSQIHEAMKRHRLERGEAERFMEGLLGLKLDREHYERGEAFARGVVERAGVEGLNRLWEREAMVPTPPELEAPGLWLARLELPDPDATEEPEEPT